MAVLRAFAITAAFTEQTFVIVLPCPASHYPFMADV